MNSDEIVTSPTPAPARTRRQDPSTASPRSLSRKKKILFICATVLLGGALVAGALELMLRFFAPQPLLPRYVTGSEFGIRVHCPNISIHHTTADYRIAIRTNSMGIRADREFSFDKPDGVFRVVGLGDSFTFGYGVDVQDTYLARLERLLRDKGVNAEVINLGVSGAGTAEELIMLNQVAMKFQPDFVILGFYVNDVADNVRSMLYALDEHGALVRKRKEYLPAVKARDFLYSFALYRFLAERSHALYYVRRNLAEAVQVRLRKKNAATQSLESDGEKRLTAALLDEISRTCRQRKIAFTILDIPRTDYSNLPRGLLAAVDENQIVDLRPTFKEQMQGEKLYWTRSDGHWTPLGHQIASRILAENVLRSLPARR